MSNEQRIAEIRARAGDASPGPWGPAWSGYVDGPANVGTVTPSGFRRGEDARFIAGARDDVPWLLDHLAAAERDLAAQTARVEQLSAENAKLREALSDRQRYIHAEIHVDERGHTVGHWRNCNRPTCSDTRAALAQAAEDGQGGGSIPQGGGSIPMRQFLKIPCETCSHPIRRHELGASSGRCIEDGCTCSEPRFDFQPAPQEASSDDR